MTEATAQLVEEQDTRWYLLSKKNQELRIRRVFELCHSIDVSPILIKGWGAARSYPDHHPRYSSDIDLAVSEADHQRTQEFLHSKTREKLNVDLHCELRHLDRSRWENVFARSAVVELDGVEVRLPCPEDHLRILSAHWLTDGGANKDRLWDIYYAVENRPKDFDWAVCLDAGGPTRRNWTITTIAIAHQVLGWKIDDLPCADEAGKVPGWVMKALKHEWESGVPLRPLHTCLRDRKALFQQIRKRIPPNPIQATVDMDRPFDETNRLFIQLRSIIKRAGPSFNRIFEAIGSRGKNK